MKSLADELYELIEKHDAGKISQTSNKVLASFLYSCLFNWNYFHTKKEQND